MTHQIRALYDTTTITVYQAYSSAIATPAVAQQLLSASPSFSITRMTWIKPSWSWMLYRSGYSYKDARQERILALKMKREYFETLLMSGVVSDDRAALREEKENGNGLHTRVRIQWDPERNFRLDKMEGVRSIQIGIPAGLCGEWVNNGIVEIEDVTERARELKRVLDEEGEQGKIGEDELVESGLIPRERVYLLREEVARVVGADS